MQETVVEGDSSVQPRPQSPEGGFTVVEVLVASTVLLIALIGSALLFENAMVVSGNTRNRVVAAQLATQSLETVRGTAADPTKFTTIPLGNVVTSQTVNGITYTISQAVQLVDQRSSQSSCDSTGSGNGKIMQVTESVTWKGMAGTKPVQQTTTLAPPVGAYDASSGSIAVKVFDSTGRPAANVNTQITGPDSQTQQTTAEGCAFFPFIDVGTYTVSIIEGTGVGDQEQLVPSQNTSVSVGQTASIQFNYDTAATITMTGYANSAATPATNLSIGVANTGLQPYKLYSFPNASVGMSLTPLFPYASGYTVYAGACNDNNPVGLDGTGNPYYTATPPAPTTTGAGATTTATANLYDLPVHVQNGSGTAQASAIVTAVGKSYARPYQLQCTNGTANISAPTLGLVATDAAGNSTTGMPLGHFTVTAKSGTKTGSVNVWVKPDGVYAVNSGGAATTKYPGAITVVVS